MSPRKILSEAGLGENLDLTLKPPATRLRLGDPNPTPPVPALGESPESSLHSLQARGTYQRAAAGGTAWPAACPQVGVRLAATTEGASWGSPYCIAGRSRSPLVVPAVALYSITAGAVVPRALGTFREARPSPGGTIGLGRDQD